MPHIRTTDTATQKREEKYRGWAYTEEIAADAPAGGPDEVTAYRDLIQRDGAVCDTCFTRRYDVMVFQWFRGSFGWMDYEKWHALPGRSTPVPSDDGVAAEGNRLACADCGENNGKRRPIPKDRIHDYAANLSNTLTDKQIPHDPETLHREVERRNTSENQMRQDSHVFEPAVTAAIQAAREPMPFTVVQGTTPKGQDRPRAQDGDLVERGGRRQASEDR